MKKKEVKPENWRTEVYILIPAYNAAHQLLKLLPSLLSLVPNNKICIVNDGSHDNTEEVCSSFNITCLSQYKNGGKGAALKIGFSYLMEHGAQWILTMDADGQHAVEDIPSFIDLLKKYPRAGIIGGSRKLTPRNMPVARVFSNRITSLFLSLICHKKILDSQCGFRMYSTELLKNISLHYKHFEMESEIILKACFSGFQIFFIPIQTLYFSDQSHISHIKDIIRWIRAVITIWIENKKSKNKKESDRNVWV
ncbi:MAG: glycosyltransferase family 2 protein [Chitinispirillia bacterium]|jgi:glycosyltransferase involved in cell wall biosynthesis